MPIYEYECKECGHDLEAIQKISDAPLVTCPSCNKDSLEKKQSLTSFQLKGGGWYKDGYNGKSNVGSGSAPKAEAKKPAAGKGTPASDSKKKLKPAS